MRKKEGGGRRGIYASREEEEEDAAASGLIWKSPALMTGVGGAVGKKMDESSFSGRKEVKGRDISYFTYRSKNSKDVDRTDENSTLDEIFVCLMAYFLAPPLFVHLCK